MQAHPGPEPDRRRAPLLVGGESAANISRGHGLRADGIHVVTPGEPITLGSFTATLIESNHCPPDRSPGAIVEPVRPPVPMKAYRCGEAWSILLAHGSGRTALVQGSAGYVEGALEGHRADVAYLGAGQLGVQDEDYLRTYWAQTVRTVGAHRVVLTH